MCTYITSLHSLQVLRKHSNKISLTACQQDDTRQHDMLACASKRPALIAEREIAMITGLIHYCSSSLTTLHQVITALCHVLGVMLDMPSKTRLGSTTCNYSIHKAARCGAPCMQGCYGLSNISSIRSSKQIEAEANGGSTWAGVMTLKPEPSLESPIRTQGLIEYYMSVVQVQESPRQVVMYSKSTRSSQICDHSIHKTASTNSKLTGVHRC